jgi:hypothetical protein
MSNLPPLEIQKAAAQLRSWLDAQQPGTVQQQPVKEKCAADRFDEIRQRQHEAQQKG